MRRVDISLIDENRIFHSQFSIKPGLYHLLSTLLENLSHSRVGWAEKTPLLHVSNF